MMGLFSLLLIIGFGLAAGSFLSALTYRLPRGKSVSVGRSICPQCKKKISWYDNIPLLSYLVLTGKCRNCGKKISLRYPLVELGTALLFVLVYISITNCTVQGPSLHGSPACSWNGLLGMWALPYLLLVSAILIAVFVTDTEKQMIPDELVYAFLAIVVFAHIIGDNPNLYNYLFSGFAASLSLMFLHFITLGRGMGLGDVKLVIPMGMVLGWPYTLVWFYVSFVGGGLVGLILILAGKAKFGREIAFGPFLISAFFAVLLWGDWIKNYILPFL